MVCLLVWLIDPLTTCAPLPLWSSTHLTGANYWRESLHNVSSLQQHSLNLNHYCSNFYISIQLNNTIKMIKLDQWMFSGLERLPETIVNHQTPKDHFCTVVTFCHSPSHSWKHYLVKFGYLSFLMYFWGEFKYNKTDMVEACKISL